MASGAHAAAEAAQTAERMSQAGVETVQIPDGDGTPHTYMIALHSVDDGLDVVGALISIGGSPLGSLLQGVAGQLLAEGVGGVGEAIANLDGDAAELIGSIDWSAVGRDAAEAVQRVKLSVFAAEILKFSHRDGHSLANGAVRNAAYRGNYGELYRALLAVIQANRFIPF
jgi:hypothetical protein